MNQSEIINKIQKLRNMLIDLENTVRGGEEKTFSSIGGNFDELKKLVLSDEWPEAVPADLICDEKSEVDKTNRAQGVVEVLISEPVDGKRCLDFGTGEGHVTREIANHGAAYAMGYDIVNNFMKQGPRMQFTTEWKSVQDHGPYDVVLISDVLDHLVDLDPVEALKRVKSVLNENGKVYLRRHNYMSRHGTHLYRQLNKAFLHLVFNETEMTELIENPEPLPTYRYYFPIKTYTDQINQSGLVIKSDFRTTTPVEGIFERREILDRIFENTPYKHFPKIQMEVDFVDYVLEHQ